MDSGSTETLHNEDIDDDQYEDSPLCFTDFRQNDIIFEEQEPDTSYNISQTLRTSILTVFSMTFLVTFSTLLLCIPLLYFDLHFANICDRTEWKDLPKRIQQIHLYCHCLSDHLFMFWYMLNIWLVFRIDGVVTKLIFLFNMLAGSICTIYRLSTYIFEIYASSSWLGTPQYLIYLTVMILAPWVVFSNEGLNTREKCKLCFITSFVYVIVFIINYLNLFIILPTFLKYGTNGQFYMATFVPILGYIARVCSRKVLSFIKRQFHPGDVYVLYSHVYAVTILFYRILHASVKSLPTFFIIGLIHALIGFLQIIFSELFIRKIIGFIKRFILRREFQLERTRKEKRVRGDTLVVGIMYEVWGITITNCAFFLYAVQHQIPIEHGSTYNFWSHFKDLSIRLSYLLSIEIIFTSLSIVIVTLKTNVAVNKIWRQNWKRFAFVLVVNGALAILVTTKPLTSLVEQSYHKYLVARGDKHLAEQLYLCNTTIIMKEPQSSTI